MSFSERLFSIIFFQNYSSEKKCQDVYPRKKIWFSEKTNNIFPIAMQKSTQNRQLILKKRFWGSSAASNIIFFF